MTTKPVVFFSHSSRDRDVVLPIRDQLLTGTGNAINVFMSSDGASIPFGRNWLREIEDALSICKLMFVWLTPNSLLSSWIPFEAGHAYARNIHVVPIGFLGTSLSKVPAPLNLLQGFDITSAAGLNNIVATINKQFGLTFHDLFDEGFYTIVSGHSETANPDLLRFVDRIMCSFTRISLNGDHAEVRSTWRQSLKTVLEGHNIPFSGLDNLLGVGFRVYESSSTSEREVHAAIDPMALNMTWPVWTDAVKVLYKQDLPYAFLSCRLTESWRLPKDEYLIGSRLLGSEVIFDHSDHATFGFRNVLFRIQTNRSSPGKEKELLLLIPRDNQLPIPLYPLLRLLEDRQVIIPTLSR